MNGKQNCVLRPERKRKTSKKEKKKKEKEKEKKKKNSLLPCCFVSHFQKTQIFWKRENYREVKKKKRPVVVRGWGEGGIYRWGPEDL